MLQDEGVEFDKDGRVSMDSFLVDVDQDGGEAESIERTALDLVKGRQDNKTC